MTGTSNRIRSAASIAVATLLVGALVGTASAEVPTMTPSTPTIIGGQVIGSGHTSIGASAGYPGARGEFVFGMGRTFDLSIQPELTYGNTWISGLNQGFGIDVEVPLRFTLATMQNAALALRVVPYFRIGRAAPSWGTGGTIGLRASIPLRKLFSIVVGGETRMGLGSFHFSNCVAGLGYSCNNNFFEGATYAVIGLETFFHDHWFFFAENDIGGAYTSGGGYQYGRGLCFDTATGLYYNCGGAGHAFFNAHIGFGYMMR